MVIRLVVSVHTAYLPPKETYWFTEDRYAFLFFSTFDKIFNIINKTYITGTLS